MNDIIFTLDLEDLFRIEIFNLNLYQHSNQ